MTHMRQPIFSLINISKYPILIFFGSCHTNMMNTDINIYIYIYINNE